MRTCLWITLLCACGSGSGANITKMVGPAGGTVGQSDGTSVSIPMGALGSSANITITPVSVTPPTGFVLVGQADDFGPDGTSFAQPVTISLPFEMSKIPSGHTADEIVIMTAARGSTNFSPLATTLASGSVSTQTSHFTVYAPMAPSGSVIVEDLGGGGGAMDMSPASCTPSCTTGTSGCSCTETCGSTVTTMSCNGGTGSYGCFCEINGQTGQTFDITDCSLQSNVQGSFLSHCAG